MIGVIFLLVVLGHATVGSKLCPSHCLCYELSDLVDCQSRGLASVPSGIPHGTWLLDLSGNRMTQVQSRSFRGLWSLKILLISNNSIQTLQPESLSSLEFLERLDLSYNRLKTLPPDFSHKLFSLKELRLNHNFLHLLDPTSLHDLENLRKLDLSYNQITSLDVRLFNSLSHLNYLNLEGNKLNVLVDDLLSRQQNLQILHLGHNNISVIENQAFTPLRSLTLLSLHGNQLVHIRFKTFLELQTANTHLQLSSNPWTCDCELQRVFGKIQRVKHLQVVDYKDIICHGPLQLAGRALTSLDSQLCMAETVSVLVITITVLLAVIGALVKAERNQKNKQSQSESDEDKHNK
ncbi:slit homolog 2 protein [Boleophthalmus pectinirostris]|uniref:slit homolog 2 protein n=1 Tax=Boleophthalmus pectinirostris TaxID=150288 RepID=UPI00242FC17C|nr:slit homolog 2 protein [Boleophthalmus pectinirostris]